MRIKTTVGLVVGAAAAAAVVGGGVAYAVDEPEPRPVVRIVTDETAGDPAADARNCPDRSGSGQPGETGRQDETSQPSETGQPGETGQPSEAGL